MSHNQETLNSTNGIFWNKKSQFVTLRPTPSIPCTGHAVLGQWGKEVTIFANSEQNLKFFQNFVKLFTFHVWWFFLTLTMIFAHFIEPQNSILFSKFFISFFVTFHFKVAKFKFRLGRGDTNEIGKSPIQLFNYIHSHPGKLITR